MNMTRRSLVASGFATCMASAFGGPSAAAETLPPVRMGVSFKAANATVINLLIGERLGYAKKEGIELGLVTTGSIGAMLAGIGQGTFECCGVTISMMAPLLAKGQLPPITAIYEFTYPYKWDIAVKPDSPIKTYEDLRGKKIGVESLGTTTYPVTRMVLSRIGLDPDKDVQWQAVGAGTTSGIALKDGVIDALSYFDTGFDQIEIAGIPFRILPRPKTVPLIGGFMIGARREYLKEHRDRLIGFGRCIAKSTVFTLANPAAAASVFLDMYPGMARRGVSRDESVHTIVHAMKRRIEHYQPPYSGAKLGSMNSDEMRLEADFAGFKNLDISSLYTNELIDEINKFDQNEIVAEAKSFKF